MEKVSILIPVYNRAHCIEQTLASALAQRHADIEVVVVDNASTDDSWALISKVAAGDARVRAFRNETNIGPVRNWLRCVREAGGTYGKILFSDDLLHPDFLSEALPLMADPEIGFVFSPILVFDDGAPEEGQPYYGNSPPGRRPGIEFIEGTLLGGEYPVSPGCALFRLEDMRGCLLEQVPNRVASDFAMHAIGSDLLLFLLVAARYAYTYRLPEARAYFRDHAGSITTSSARGRIPLHYDIAKAYFVQRHPLPARTVARFNALLLLDLLRFPDNAWGLRSLADFYPEAGSRPVAPLYFLKRLAGLMLLKLRQFAGGRQ
jgi:glycosyltransferase involved in cell wall biosynthesis